MNKINFTVPSKKKKATQTNQSSSSDKCTEQQMKKKMVFSNPTDDELQAFYKELSKTDGQPALLPLIPGFNEAYIPAKGMPKPLTDLYNPDKFKLSYPELLEACEQIYDFVSFTFDQAVTVEKETRTQAKSQTWFKQRSRRLLLLN